MRAVTAIVPSAGAGKRFGAKKPFVPLLGKSIIVWTLSALAEAEEITEIIPVFGEADMALGLKLIEEHSIPKIKLVAMGGAERQDSVHNGLKLLSPRADLVLIHDGARPLIEKSVIRNTIAGLEGHDGAIAAVPVKDTIKEATKDMVVSMTLKRDALWAVQTPQIFEYSTLMAAYEKAASEGVGTPCKGFSSLDDASLVERYGGRVKIVMGSYKNIKITTPEDLAIAEMFLRGGL